MRSWINPPLSPRRLPLPAAGALVALAYYLSARLSLQLSLVEGIVSPVWPPTGIALVALLRLGMGVWPAITAAAFLVNFPIAPSLPAALAIAAGNTFAPLLAALFLERVGFRKEMDRLSDGLSIVFLGALLAMMVSATFGTTTLLLSDVIAPADYAGAWAVWWAGDATGVLLFAPVLLSIRLAGRRISWLRAGEAAALFAALTVVSVYVFWQAPHLEYLPFPLLVWAAVRFGVGGGSSAALIVAGAAISAAVNQVGPFAGANLLEAMLTLQVFNAGAALTCLVLAAITQERTKANQALEKAASKLQERVAERSARLATTEQRLESERRIAETLQRSLLPETLPVIPGIALAARYLPGAAGLDVGGDWYDVFHLPDGRIGLAIGDVVGRGLRAAASMGQMRTALRAYALDSESTAVVVDRLNSLVQTLDAAEMATALYGVLDPTSHKLCFASAGHLPPLLISPEGKAGYVALDTSAPLGVAGRAAKEECISLLPGSTIVFYTDGLVERRGAAIDAGMLRLQNALEGFSGDLDSLSDHALVEGLQSQAPKDDVAILAVRLEPLAHESFHVELQADAKILSLARRALQKWLERHGAGEEQAKDVVLAASEAITNVLEHAYGAGGGPLHLGATTDAGVVTITVRDFGSWRNRRKDDQGRGFLLMKALVDSVDVDTAEDGTEVRLRSVLGTGKGPDIMPVDIPEITMGGPDAGNVSVVELSRELDLTNVESVKHALNAAVGNQDLGLVLDLSRMGYLDSAGIRLLFQLAGRLRGHRQHLRLVMAENSPIRRVISLIELDKVAPVKSTVSAAVDDIKAAQRRLAGVESEPERKAGPPREGPGA